jgi:hypothetical protein
MNEVHAEIQKRKDKKDGKKDDKQDELFAKWTKEQEALLAEWAEKASCYRWLHGRAEKKYRRSNYAFTIPVIIMSTLTGTANFAMDSFVPEENKQMAMACVGGVNILAGIISTLQNFLRFAELMESHRTSGVSWSKLNRDICVELSLDPPRRKPAGDFLNVCRAEYDRLIEQSPLIDDSILKMFHNKFHDTDINKPEMCNGLDKCEIYKPSVEEKAATIMSSAASKFTSFKSNVNNESKEMKETKKELHGLTKLNKVSNMKKINVKPLSEIEKKEELHSELVGILGSNKNKEVKVKDEVKDEVKEEVKEEDKTLEQDDIEKKLSKKEDDDDLSDLDKPSKDFLNAIIDEK